MRRAIICLVLAVAAGTAGAQPGKTKVAPPKPRKVPIFDMPALGFDGTARTASLLYFLERAHDELERASLERRSFVPEMIRTVDEEAL